MQSMEDLHSSHLTAYGAPRAAEHAASLHGQVYATEQASEHTTEHAAPLHGVVLASETRARFSAQCMRELAIAESERHARLGLTGHAYFHAGRLIEYIEGPAESIDALIASVDRDPRFALRQVVRAEALPARRFAAWELDAITDNELMDLRLEHVLEALLQNFATSLFGQERTQSAIWRLVDAIARRQAKAAQSGKAAARRRTTRLVTVH
jgi:hypothetical protein